MARTTVTYDARPPKTHHVAEDWTALTFDLDQHVTYTTAYHSRIHCLVLDPDLPILRPITDPDTLDLICESLT